MAHILIIEDDLMMLEILLRTLKREGHDVIGALDGEEGMRLYQQMNFDVVITDLFFPDTMGLEIILKLKNEASLKIIAISGVASCLDMARRMGAHCSFTKPFSTKELSAAVKELIDE